MLKHILRDPLFYFLLAGGLLFVASPLFDSDPDKRVVLTKADQIELVRKWQKDFDRLPIQSEFDTLADRWVRDELSVREAIAMELDRDDAVIRRRLIQKLEYLVEERALEGRTEEALIAFYQSQSSRYVRPATFTFTHHFFSDVRRAAPKRDAEVALVRIGESSEVIGDPFIQHRNYHANTYRQISEVFGVHFADWLVRIAEQDFVQDTTALNWNGPAQSSYGYHLVQLQAYAPARRESFEEAYDRIVSDYQAERRNHAKDQLFEELLNKYDVVLE